MTQEQLDEVIFKPVLSPDNHPLPRRLRPAKKVVPKEPKGGKRDSHLNSDGEVNF